MVDSAMPAGLPPAVWSTRNRADCQHIEMRADFHAGGAAAMLAAVVPAALRVLRQVAGGMPNSRLKARLNAASDS